VTELPSGTVTFLFTDLEGSTRLWEEQPGAMEWALARHDQIVRDSIEAHQGHVVKQTGDGFHAVFAVASDAIVAAVEAQATLEREPWPVTARLAVRMGIHSGKTQERGGDYYGSATNRAARLMGVGHGGQIVVSDVAASLVGDNLVDGVEFVPLGEHRLRDLAAPLAVFQLAAPGLRSEFPPLRTLSALPGNLPAELSSFVGRAKDVEQLRALVTEARVVTLTGVGGVGKTRLALQVAGAVRPRFPDGVWLVELAGVRDPDVVAETVAIVLGVPDQSGIPVVDLLVQFLRAKQALLVLDNCEHLLDASAELVQTLERACRDLVVLATSREGLGIAGERLVPVSSLLDTDSVQLFVERAVAVRNDFEATEANLPAITEICRRLDGIPLAIELAAARVAVLSPAQIAQRLDQRFRILAGGNRGAVERHATLRAAIDWSFDLLTTEEQRVLVRLSVFAGGCSLDAAEVVCAGGPIAPTTVLDHLSTLVARSLLVTDTSDVRETSYRLLETIRQYAEELLDLDENDETRNRHARYYADWERVALKGLQSAQQLQWFSLVESEVENLRIAVEWAVTRGDHELGYEMLSTATLPPFTFLLAARAIFDNAESVLEIVRVAGHHVADTIAAASIAVMFTGRHDRALELSNEALALAGGEDVIATARAYATQTRIALDNRDYPRFAECMQHIVAYARKDGTTFELSWALAARAQSLGIIGEIDTARNEAQEALALARRTHTPSLLIGALVALAYIALESDPDTARAHLLEAVELREPFGHADPNGLDNSIMGLGVLLDEPDVILWEAAQILRVPPAERLLLVYALESLAAAVAANWPEYAATLHGAVDTLMPGFAEVGPFAATRSRLRLSIVAAIGTDAETRSREHGTHMSQDEATAFAHSILDEVWPQMTGTQIRPVPGK
jgi:predicted ATPase/class 3 adenylate cyclase